MNISNIDIQPEHSLAQKRPQAYWRLEDKLCREFLQLGINKTDFESVELFFPFVRLASVFQVPRDFRHVADWLYLAFLAGTDLGFKQPDLVEAILPGWELNETKRRLTVLQQKCPEVHLTGRGLHSSFETVASERFEAGPVPNPHAAMALLLLKALRAGFAAVTVAQNDPVHCEYVCGIDGPVAAKMGAILDKALVSASWRALEEGLGTIIRHPVLLLAQELYPGNTTECDTILRFISQRLEVLGVTNQNECPLGDEDILGWIAAGLEYGRKVKTEQPEVVANIFEESKGSRLEGSLKVVREAVAKAGKVEPSCLLGPIKEWQLEVYGKEADYYGDRLTRVSGHPTRLPQPRQRAPGRKEQSQRAFR